MTDSSEFSPEQASDPGTSMQDMARIAAERPDLWASLAANPSLYPDLRKWLGQVDDPAVKEALNASAQQAAGQVPVEDAPAAEAGSTKEAVSRPRRMRPPGRIRLKRRRPRRRLLRKLKRIRPRRMRPLGRIRLKRRRPRRRLPRKPKLIRPRRNRPSPSDNLYQFFRLEHRCIQ